MIKYRAHPYTIYELLPNYVSSNGRNTHNEHGFRGKSFEIEKVLDTKRVVCLGESTTYCGELKDGDTYPDCLERHLIKGLDENIEVINGGIEQYNSIEVLIRFMLKVQPLNPNLIVYYYTYNDVTARIWPNLGRDYYGHSRPWRQVTPLLDRISGRATLALKKGVNTTGLNYYVRRMGTGRSFEYLKDNPSTYFRDNISMLAALTKFWGMRLLIVSPPFYGLEDPDFVPAESPNYQTGVYEHRKVIEEIGQTLDVPVFDVLPLMPVPPASKADPNEYYRDPVHFSEKGADLIAGFISSYIIEHGLLD